MHAVHSYFTNEVNCTIKSKGVENKSLENAIVKIHNHHLPSTTCASSVILNRMAASTLSSQSLMDANVQNSNQMNGQQVFGTLLSSKDNLFKQSSPPMNSGKYIIKKRRMLHTIKSNGDNLIDIFEMRKNNNVHNLNLDINDIDLSLPDIKNLLSKLFFIILILQL